MTDRDTCSLGSIRDRSSVLSIALALWSLSCTTPLPEDAPSALLFSRTTEYRHASIDSGIEPLIDEARRRGIRLEATEDPARFNPAELARHRAVIFFNTTGDVLDDAQQRAFERYIQSGGGYVGIHAAADTEWKGNLWPWYTRLVGGAFRSHPSTPSNVQKARLSVVDAGHPATSGLPTEWERVDEWYDYQRFNPNVSVLLTVDESSYQGGVTGDPHPIAWHHEFDGGRSFYTGLGHTEESFAEELFLDHLFGGLGWAMGEGAGPPELDSSRVRPEDWRLVHEPMAVGIGEPISMAFTPTGELYVVERQGRVRRWHEDTKRLDTIAELEVFTSAENGIGGIVFDPGWEENGWVYLYRAVDGDPLPANRLSRFTLRGDDLDVSSEVVLLEFSIDRGATSHEGGDLQFDADGHLWISTGDDTNPHQSDGFSPMDDFSAEPIYDARRSAANSQDLRGKILRIRPRPDGGYDIPAGNLFADAAQGRPEIYAMGLRNPYRIWVDSPSGTLFWGEIGPDGKEDGPDRGPRGYDEFNRTTKPGNFGWPLVLGPGLPYAAYDFEKKEAGAFFDPAAPVNESKRNTGLRELPPAQPAWMAYSYDAAGPHFDLESGSSETGRSAMVAGVYHRDSFSDGPARLSEYYDGKLVIYEFMRDWIKLVDMGPSGEVLSIETLPTELDLVAPIDVEFGPDGSIWVLEYGSVWFTDNTDSRLSRISYFSGDNPLPVAVADVAPAIGAAPLALTLDATGSFDRNPDDTMAYRWRLHGPDGVARELGEEATLDAEVAEPGRYEVELEVTDSGGGRSTARHVVVVGNAAPSVELRVDGNETFFFPEVKSLPYAVHVSDAEDGSVEDGGIDPAAVRVRFDYLRSGRPAREDWMEARAQVGRSDPADAKIEEFGCRSCHAAETSSAGPAFSAIAQRYGGNREHAPTLARKIIDGGSGVWGERAMPAQPHVSEADALKMVQFLLTGSSAGDDVEMLPLTGALEFGAHEKFTENWDILGRVDRGVYRLEAAYTDQGADGASAVTSTQVRTLRSPRMFAANVDRSEGWMTVALPERDAVPAMFRSSMPEVPPDFQMLLAQKSGGAAVLENIDLTGVDSMMFTTTAPSVFANGGVLEVRVDDPDGPVVGRVEVESSLMLDVGVHEVDLSGVTGRHDLLLIYDAGDEEPPGFLMQVIEFQRSGAEE